MPMGDRTGPNGQGPMTGRGLGFCAGNDRPGFMEPGYGRGMAWRRGGFGRGFRGRAWQSRFVPQLTQPQQPQLTRAQQGQQNQQLSSEQEKQILQQDKDSIKKDILDLKQELDEIEDRLKNLS